MEVLGAGSRLDAARGEVVVGIPVYGALELFERCLTRVVEGTPEEAWILVSDDAGPTGAEAITRRVAGARGRVGYRRRETNGGFVRNANDIFAAAGGGDVVLLNSDVEVPRDWLPRLQAAALSDSTIATATPFTNHGTIVSLPYRNQQRPGLPPGWTLETADAAIAARSRRLRPRLPTCIGHCVYIRRSALELIGGFDEAFAPAYGEEVDFSQRCLHRGLGHVLADDLFVLHHGKASHGSQGTIQEDHERLIGERYRYYHGWIAEVARDNTSPLAHSIGIATLALRPLTVTVDGSCLLDAVTGTQVHTLEVIQALAAAGVAVRVAVPKQLGAHAKTVLGGVEAVTTVRWEDVGRRTARTDVVHRPYQVGRTYELQKLFWLGERVVITHQDFIAYRNPSYFDSLDWWRQYRQLARLSLAVADRVVFFSKHAQQEALSEEIVPRERTAVVYIGVDHRHEEIAPPPVPPPAHPELESTPFMLCLGVDFRHKNRLFAMDVLAKLRNEHAWDGKLVLAGPRASPGSSFGEEMEWLAGHPAAAPAIVDLHSVPEPVKQWLIERAALVIAPSTYEGFGLVPFEAAAAGVPCLFARQASLEELLPAEAALIEPWDAAAAAASALRLMGDEAARRRQVELVRAAGAAYRWEATAQSLIGVYRDAVEDSPPAARAFVDSGLLPSPTATELRVLDPRKALRFWREYGFVEGTTRGVRGVGRRVRRRVSRR